MKNIEQLVKEFGTHENYIQQWIEELDITTTEINFALANFDKQQRRSIMSSLIRPSKYLASHHKLIKCVNFTDIEDIKNLPANIFNEHLAQLKLADSLNDKINNRSFPYNSYDAELFIIFRNATKKTDIAFAKRMYPRRISHHTYPAAKKKLLDLSLLLAA
jgi:hypothetical protein